VSQARFQKQQRERTRKERAAMKTARKEERREEKASAEPGEAVDEQSILAELAALHAKYDAGEIEFDDFLTAREEITQRLVDIS
jgi:hypothetical protein